MFYNHKEKELLALTELHYIHGVEFPFPLTLKMLRKRARKIKSDTTPHRVSSSNRKREEMALMELHYCYGIDFPFLHQKPKEKPRKIIQTPKPPENLHIVSIWRQR